MHNNKRRLKRATTITIAMLTAISAVNLSGVTVYGENKTTSINDVTVTNMEQNGNYEKNNDNGVRESNTVISNAEGNAVENCQTITIIPDEHITVSDSESLTQKVAVNEAMSTVVLTAEEDYYFPDGYTAAFSAENSGITVTRNSASQITVSGTLSDTVTDNLTITLPAPTEKIDVTIQPKQKNSSYIYSGGAISFATRNPFTIPDGIGSQHYSVRGITGEGSIKGTELTVTKAGTFEITVTTDATSTHKAGHATTTVTVEKGNADCGLQVKRDAETGWDIVYGDSYTVYAESTTNKDVTIYYKLDSADDSTYSTQKPVNPGFYRVKAVFAETDLYKEGEATTTFPISRATPEIISLPTITRTYDAAATLKDIALSECVVHGVDGKPLDGTWSWTKETTVPSVNTKTYSAKFTPSDTTNYRAVTASIPITVKPRELTVSGVTAQNRPFNRNNLVAITGITLNGVTGNDDVSVDTNSMQGILNSIYTGAYRFVTLPQLTLTGNAKENYVLVQPTDAVATDVTIEKADAEITLNQTSYTKTFGDGDFTLDVTDNNTDIDVNYEVISGTDVVSVSPDGIVTMLKAGNATIRVSLPESQNFNAATSKDIRIEIQKKSSYNIDIYKNYLYSKENPDDIDLTKYLPKDSGEVEWNEVRSSIPEGPNYHLSYDIDTPTVEESQLTYTVLSGNVGDKGRIQVDISSENYADIKFEIYITLTDKSPVHLKEGTAVTLQNNVLTHGEPLSSLAFQSAVFVDDNGTEVAGTLAWKNPSSTASSITAYETWVFTPNDTTTYASLEGTVAITVNKATPVLVSTPQVKNDITYHPFDVVLKNSDLTGGKVTEVGNNTEVSGTWRWKETNIHPTVNNSGYEAVFTPSGTYSKNYETMTITIPVTVKQAEPYIQKAPVAAAITYGDTLRSSVLSNSIVQYSDSDSTTIAGSFAWADADLKPTVADSDSRQYTVVFTPEDTVNYKTAEMTVTLTVNPSENTPDMPEGDLLVPYSCKKVGDYTLAGDWIWNTEDAGKELEVDNPVTAEAVYNGTDKDKGNYVTEKVSITITRTACEHTHTELKNVRTANCTLAGYSGDIYCADCEKEMQKGTDIAALGHRYKAVVTTEPTMTSTGVRTYTCERCGHFYTETVAKLPTDTEKSADTEKKEEQTNSGGSQSQNTEITAKVKAANSKVIDKKTTAGWKNGRLSVTWGAIEDADGYDIFAAECDRKMTSKSLVKTVKGKKTSAELAKLAGKKLKDGKNYKVKIKAYKMVDGKKVYLGNTKLYHIAGAANKNYTNAKKVTVSKKAVTLQKGKTTKIKATIVKQEKEKELLSASHGPALRYTSTNTKVAAVTSKGKIKAKGKGTCYIYVTALNGVRTKVKVTVK